MPSTVAREFPPLAQIGASARALEPTKKAASGGQPQALETQVEKTGGSGNARRGRTAPRPPAPGQPPSRATRGGPAPAPRGTPALAAADLATPQAGPLDSAQIETRLQKLIDTTGLQRHILNADLVRVGDYAKTVRRMMDMEAVKEALPQIKEAMREQEDAFRAEQATATALLRKGGEGNTYDLNVGRFSYAAKLYDLTQEVAKKLGFTKEVELVIDSSIGPNAFVYTSDMERPRVTFFTSLVQKCWDNRTQDWIKIPVDAKGKPVEPGTAGAKELAIGRNEVEFVLSHELGHIRDEITQTTMVLIYLFLVAGRDLTPRDASKSKNGGASEHKKKLAELETKLRGIAGGLLRNCNTKAGAVASDAPQAFAALKTLAQQSKADVTKPLLHFAKSLGFETSAAKKAGLSFQDLFRFVEGLRIISQDAERTADRFGVLVQNTPEFGGALIQMLSLDIQPAASEEAQARQWAKLLAAGNQQLVDSATLQLAEVDKKDYLDFVKALSHPPAALRIHGMLGFWNKTEGAAQHIRDFRNASASQRLLGVLQIFERRNSDVVKSRKQVPDTICSHYPAPSKWELAQLQKQQTKIQNEAEPFLKLCDDAVGAQGLFDANNEFAKLGMKFIMDNGLEMHKKAPMLMLAQRWHSAIKAGLENGSKLTEQQRHVGKERREVLAKVLRLADKSLASLASSSSSSASSSQEDSDSDFSDSDSESDRSTRAAKRRRVA